jgi:hypothetical protein
MFDLRAGCWVFEELHLCFEYNNRFPIEFGVGAATAQLGGGGGGGGGSSVFPVKVCQFGPSEMPFPVMLRSCCGTYWTPMKLKYECRDTSLLNSV